MKTNVIKVSCKESDIALIQNEIEKVASYNELSKKSKNQLLLLAEELLGLEKGILGFTTGEFYVENDGADYKLCLHSDINIDIAVQDKFVELSSSQKNEAYKGFMGKVRYVADSFMFGSEHADLAGCGSLCTQGPAIQSKLQYDCDMTWSYSAYREEVNENTEEWDELEHSIVANLADDVVVAARQGSVDIIVIKRFE